MSVHTILPDAAIATVSDLFCGAGGLSLGFHAAGARCIAALDHDKKAAATFERNFARLQPDNPPVVLRGEAASIGEIDLRTPVGGVAPDILIGGPPCQGFSRIGRAKLDSLSDEGFAGDPRNTLYVRFLEAVTAWKPRALVVENVPGILSVKGRNVALEVAADLAACGYRVGYVLLNSIWYGVPQFRERIFFIGVRADCGILPSAPLPTHRTTMPAGYLRPKEAVTLPLAFLPYFELSIESRSARHPATTAGEALDDLPLLNEHLQLDHGPRGEFRRERSYRADAESSYPRLMREWPGLPASRGVIDHAIRHTPRDFDTFRLMRPGDRYPEALAIAEARFREELMSLAKAGMAPPPETPAYEKLRRRFVPPYPVEIFVDKWRKLRPDEPSWTVPAHLSKDTYSHIHHDSEQARTISIREAARLQSFPDAYEFEGNMGECYRQIGNAVPPLLAWSVAAHLLGSLGFQSTPPPWSSTSAASLEQSPSWA